jgi:hypothetical protein
LVYDRSVVFVLLVEIDPDGDEHGQDRCNDPVDDQAERRPPAAAIADSTAITVGRPSATAKPT